MLRYDTTQLGAESILLERFFLTRENGERAYPFFREQLQMVAEGHALVLVFPPNQLVDASFADESIIRLGEEMIAGAFGERGLLLEGLTEDSMHNINAVIQLRHLKLALLFIQPDGTWQTLGQIEPSLHETLELVAQHSQLTAPELAGILHIAINGASNRLKRLYDQHLIRREYEVSNRGLEYRYSFWQ